MQRLTFELSPRSKHAPSRNAFALLASASAERRRSARLKPSLVMTEPATQLERLLEVLHVSGLSAS